MKILHNKIYNKETKDCELFVRFTEKEMKNFAKDAGFIQDEYFCMSSFCKIEKKGITQMSGILATGMKENKQYKLGFNLHYDYDINEDKSYYLICLQEKNKIYKYSTNLSIITVEKHFLLDLIKDGLLKY